MPTQKERAHCGEHPLTLGTERRSIAAQRGLREFIRADVAQKPLHGLMNAVAVGSRPELGEEQHHRPIGVMQLRRQELLKATEVDADVPVEFPLSSARLELTPGVRLRSVRKRNARSAMGR